MPYREEDEKDKILKEGGAIIHTKDGKDNYLTVKDILGETPTTTQTQETSTLPIQQQGLSSISPTPQTTPIQNLQQSGLIIPPVVDLTAPYRQQQSAIPTSISDKQKETYNVQSQQYPTDSLGAFIPAESPSVSDLFKTEPDIGIGTYAKEALKTIPRIGVGLIGHFGDIYYNVLNGFSTLAEKTGMVDVSKTLKEVANMYAPSGYEAVLYGDMTQEQREEFLKSASGIEKFIYHLSDTIRRDKQFMESGGTPTHVYKALLGAIEGVAPMAIDIAAAFVTGGASATATIPLRVNALLKSVGTVSLILNSVLAKNTESGQQQGYSTGEAMLRATVPTAANFAVLTLGGALAHKLGNLTSKIAVNPKFWDNNKALDVTLSGLFTTRGILGKNIGTIAGETAMFQALGPAEYTGAILSGSKKYDPKEAEMVYSSLVSADAVLDSFISALAFGFPRMYKTAKSFKISKKFFEGLPVENLSESEAVILKDFLESVPENERKKAENILNRFKDLPPEDRVTILERLINDPSQSLTKRVAAFTMLTNEVNLDSILGKEVADVFRGKVLLDFLNGKRIDTSLTVREYLAQKEKSQPIRPIDMIAKGIIDYENKIKQQPPKPEDQPPSPPLPPVPPEPHIPDEKQRIIQELNAINRRLYEIGENPSEKDTPEYSDLINKKRKLEDELKRKELFEKRVNLSLDFENKPKAENKPQAENEERIPYTDTGKISPIILEQKRGGVGEEPIYLEGNVEFEDSGKGYKFAVLRVDHGGKIKKNSAPSNDRTPRRSKW